MSRIVDHLMTGGTIRQKLGDVTHGLAWARRLRQGYYDSADLIPETALFGAIDLSDRVALDIGAHAGSWTQVMARRVGPGGTVVAYEAFPHYGRALSIALRVAGIDNVRVRNVAVGASAGRVDLRWQSERGDFLGGRIHIDPNAPDSPRAVQVPMVSIDEELLSQDIQAKDVGFVKIDVEGAELAVLQGASNLLSVGRPPVFLEAEPQWNDSMGHSVRDVFAEMSKYGYTPHLVPPGGIEATDFDAYLTHYNFHRTGSRPSAFHNNVLFLPTPAPQIAKAQ